MKPHHGFLIKPIFNAAMSATPYKKDFYAKLAADQSKGQEALDVYISALEKQVSILKEFQNQKEAKW